MGPKGNRCAWLDAQGILHILEAADGNELYEIPAPQVGQVTQLLVSEHGIGILGTDDSVWIREKGKTSISLGAFPQGALFSNGILVLESSARVQDLKLYDTTRDHSFFPFSDNTGRWAYSPKTGYLVRHIESTGNHPAQYLEVWHLDKTQATCRKNIWII